VLPSTAWMAPRTRTVSCARTREEVQASARLDRRRRRRCMPLHTTRRRLTPSAMSRTARDCEIVSLGRDRLLDKHLLVEVVGHLAVVGELLADIDVGVFHHTHLAERLANAGAPQADILDRGH